jgi:hypothetical protein
MAENKYRIVSDDTAFLVMTRKDGSEVTSMVSPSDIGVLSGFQWRYNPELNRVQGRVKGKSGASAYIYRVLCCPDLGFEVDHINGDPMDNRRGNLRVVTRAQNGQNRKNGYGTKDLPRGVTIAKRGNRSYFKVEHKIHGKNIHIGYFKTVADAEEAAQKWRAENMTHAG